MGTRQKEGRRQPAWAPTGQIWDNVSKVSSGRTVRNYDALNERRLRKSTQL